jgi:hypothetical protein
LLSSRVFTPLTGWHGVFRPNTKGTSPTPPHPSGSTNIRTNGIVNTSGSGNDNGDDGNDLEASIQPMYDVGPSNLVKPGFLTSQPSPGGLEIKFPAPAPTPALIPLNESNRKSVEFDEVNDPNSPYNTVDPAFAAIGVDHGEAEDGPALPLKGKVVAATNFQVITRRTPSASSAGTGGGGARPKSGQYGFMMPGDDDGSEIVPLPDSSVIAEEVGYEGEAGICTGAAAKAGTGAAAKAGAMTDGNDDDVYHTMAHADNAETSLETPEQIAAFFASAAAGEEGACGSNSGSGNSGRNGGSGDNSGVGGGIETALEVSGRRGASLAARQVLEAEWAPGDAYDVSDPVPTRGSDFGNVHPNAPQAPPPTTAIPDTASLHFAEAASRLPASVRKGSHGIRVLAQVSGELIDQANDPDSVYNTAEGAGAFVPAKRRASASSMRSEDFGFGDADSDSDGADANF